MLDPSATAAGLALSAGLIVAIGSQNAFVLRQGLRGEYVGPVVLFCAFADLVLMTAGVAGVGATLRGVPGLVPVLTGCGAAFLGWYGLAALYRATRPQQLVTGDAPDSPSLAGALARAAGFTFLNPHVYLDTILLVGSVSTAQPPGTQGSFLAGAGLASATWFASLGFGARLLVPVFARPGSWRILDLVIGATMILLALGLARDVVAAVSA